MFDNIIDRNAISKIQCPDRIGIDFVDKFIRDNSKRDYCMLSTSKLQSGYGVYIINYLTKDGEDSDREMIRVTTHIEAGNIVISGRIKKNTAAYLISFAAIISLVALIDITVLLMLSPPLVPMLAFMVVTWIGVIYMVISTLTYNKKTKPEIYLGEIVEKLREDLKKYEKIEV